MESKNGPRHAVESPEKTLSNTVDRVVEIKQVSFSEFEGWCNAVDVSSKTLSDSERDVPKFFLPRVPSNELGKMRVLKKKNNFVCVLLPHVLQVNSELTLMRKTVLSLLSKIKSKSLNFNERVFLTFSLLEFKLISAEVPSEALVSRQERQRITHVEAEKIVLSDKDYENYDLIERQLLDRVNIIPVAMSLAQAATETGWGSSRWTRDYNNLAGLQINFGSRLNLSSSAKNENKNYVLKFPRCGLSGKYNQICAITFETIHESVQLYARRLNTVSLFKPFRSERARVTTSGECLSTKKLLQKKVLNGYAADLMYHKTLTNLIAKSSHIEKFDGLSQLPGACLANLTPCLPA